MFTAIHPKLPMRNKKITQDFYIEKLGFKLFGNQDFDEYLMLQKDAIQIHFFEFRNLNVSENYGQIYIRVEDIERFYQILLDNKVKIHPNGFLEKKPWGMREFSVLDPDNNLLTFGEIF